jgi:hypothetical protein
MIGRCLLHMRQGQSHLSTNTNRLQHHAAAQARPPSTGLFATNTARRNRNASTPQMPHLLSRLLQRTPTQTTKTRQLSDFELARGLWDMWSSCCSSRCTCPRTNWGYLLVGIHQRTASPFACPQHHQHHAAAQARPPSTGLFAANTARRNRNASTPQISAPVVWPPAKNTNPDSRDAPANLWRA